MRRRPILTRAESAQLQARRRQLQQEAMTPQEVSALMRKTVADALDRNGVVEEADFIRANVPPEAIATRGKAIIQQVVDARRERGALPDKIPAIRMPFDMSMA